MAFFCKASQFLLPVFLALSGDASISCWASPIANNLPLLRNFWESSGSLVSYHAVQHLVPDQGFQNMQKIHNRPKSFAEKTKIIPRVPLRMALTQSKIIAKCIKVQMFHTWLLFEVRELEID